MKGDCEKTNSQLCVILLSSTESWDFHLPPVKDIEINMMMYARMQI